MGVDGHQGGQNSFKTLKAFECIQNDIYTAAKIKD